MADTRISDLTALTAPALGDLVKAVDVSDTTDNAGGSSRKITASILGGKLFRSSLIDGLTLANNGTDADHDIDVAAGIATVTDGTTWRIVELTSTLVKRIDAAWAVGTNQGGLDGTESVAGTPDANTWYHVWLIMRSDTGVVDVLYSESDTSPTMPTNYDFKRRIGAVRTDGSANIYKFHQLADLFLWDDWKADVTNAAGNTSGTTVTTSVPTGISVVGKYQAIFLNNDTAAKAWSFYYPNITSLPAPASDTNDATFQADPDADVTGGQMEIRTNTSAQIGQRTNNTTSSTYWLTTLGWLDPRGRNAA